MGSKKGFEICKKLFSIYFSTINKKRLNRVNESYRTKGPRIINDLKVKKEFKPEKSLSRVEYSNTLSL